MQFRIVQRDAEGGVISEDWWAFDQAARDMLDRSFRLFEAIYCKKVEPFHHGKPAKCRACRYSATCQWRLDNKSVSRNSPQ